MKYAVTLAVAGLLGAAGGAQDRANELPGPDTVPRTPSLALTPTEYNNTVADLLGFPRFDAFTDVIAAAFGCDITRVVSLSLGEMPTAEFGADHISDKVHKGIAH